MEARWCDACHDTGSLSKQIDGHLDCHYCEATEKRKKLREHLNEQHNGFLDFETAAWAAYLFAQRQAAPVAPQPAQQVEAVGQVPELSQAQLTALWDSLPGRFMVNFGYYQFADLIFEKQREIAAAPQLEAQQAGDVALKAARYDWLVANVRSGSIGFDDWWINGDEPASEWNASIDAAIAQGRKA